MSMAMQYAHTHRHIARWFWPRWELRRNEPWSLTEVVWPGGPTVSHRGKKTFSCWPGSLASGTLGPRVSVCWPWSKPSSSRGSKCGVLTCQPRAMAPTTLNTNRSNRHGHAHERERERERDLLELLSLDSNGMRVQKWWPVWLGTWQNSEENGILFLFCSSCYYCLINLIP